MQDELVPRDKEERSRLIEHLLQAIEEDIDYKGRSNDFIESLRDQFDRRGDLSVKQVEALQKFYRNVE